MVHSLDVTVALGRRPVAPDDAVRTLLDELVAAGGAVFGVDLDGVRLVATDLDWTAGTGRVTAADGGSLVALLAARTLPDGRALPRVS